MWLTSALSCHASSTDPLTGTWTLNPGRSHYGPGAEPRVRETFACQQKNETLTCTIRSVRADGRTAVARFAASYDGRTHPVTGLPDIDQVVLRRVNDDVADATFQYRGRPVFAYRAVRSRDGKSLTIVSVDPVSRTMLESVIVYERR